MEPGLQRVERVLGQDQLVAAQNVVDVDALGGQHVDMGNVARGIGEIGFDLGAADDQHVRQPSLPKLSRSAAVLARWPPPCRGSPDRLPWPWPTARA